MTRQILVRNRRIPAINKEKKQCKIKRYLRELKLQISFYAAFFLVYGRNSAISNQYLASHNIIT